jgi:hypothetical protein
MPIPVFRSKSVQGRRAPLITVGIKLQETWYAIATYVDSGAAQGALRTADAQDRGHSVFFIAFPYTLRGGSLMPMIPITLQDHKVRVSVALEAAFGMISAAVAMDMGMDWNAGRYHIVVLDDGSFISLSLHARSPSLAPIPISC